MTATSSYLNKADLAISNAAEELTSLLRSELAASGWSLEDSLSVQVVYTGERFDYKFTGDYAESAQTTEFGNEKVRPNPVIRRFFNRAELFDKIYLRNLEAQLGDLI